MTPRRLQLLIDSDAFCKLAAANLLDEALALLGVTKDECARLSALPYMLRRGRFRTALGADVADNLQPIVASISAMAEPSPEWLDEIAVTPGIDVGEAQIFALAAEHGLLVLTNDKRAVIEVSKLSRLRSALENRIVTLEAVILGLADSMDDAELRSRGAILGQYDTMARVVFSSNGRLHDGPRSYLGQLERDTDPMTLWRPPERGEQP